MIIVAPSISYHEQTQYNRVCCFLYGRFSLFLKDSVNVPTLKKIKGHIALGLSMCVCVYVCIRVSVTKKKLQF